MKFLCFHGGAGNGPHFKKILFHLRQNLEADNTASFHFVDALFSCKPSPIPEYQAAPPHLQFFGVEFHPEHMSDVTSMGKDYGRGADKTPEEALRGLYSQSSRADHDHLAEDLELTMEYIRNFIEEEGPFQGVIGASQGASIAATVLLEDLEASRRKNVRSAFKCGLFLVGFPVLKMDGTGFVLSDESDRRITVPTCHLIGKYDPFWGAAEALRKTCDPSSAVTIEHDKHHIIPQSPELMAQVADFVRVVSRKDI